MLHRPAAFLVLITSCALAPAAAAQDSAPTIIPPAAPIADSVQQDRALFNQLVRQRQRVNRDTETAMQQAMSEARENDGEADVATKARLLSLRDERDRLLSRLLILSMRHGWAIPEMDPAAAATSSRKEAEASVFGSVDVLVRRRFAAEAQRIAIAARLPVVTLPASRN